MSFLDRIPFLPTHQGKRELIFVVLISASIMIAGFIAADLGWLYKDVPTSSTPTAVIATPPSVESAPVGTPADVVGDQGKQRPR
jgi:hypothetical protein